MTVKSNEAFVPVEDRIATFDNDATLWTEKPLYIHFYGVMTQMEGEPFLHTREPYRSVAQKDFNYFAELYENSAFASLGGQLFGVPFGGYTGTQYDGCLVPYLPLGVQAPEIRCRWTGVSADD